MPLWMEEFRKKSITAQQAANLIKSGDRIMTGNRDCRAVLRRVAARTDLKNVFYYAPIINFVPEGETIGGGLRPITSFLNSSSHQLFSEGRLDFIPSEYWHYKRQPPWAYSATWPLSRSPGPTKTATCPWAPAPTLFARPAGTLTWLSPRPTPTFHFSMAATRS